MWFVVVFFGIFCLNNLICFYLFSSATKSRTSFALNFKTLPCPAPAPSCLSIQETSSTPSPTLTSPRCRASSVGNTISDQTCPTAYSPAPAMTPLARSQTRTDDLATTSTESDQREGDLQTSDEDSSDHSVTDHISVKQLLVWFRVDKNSFSQ